MTAETVRDLGERALVRRLVAPLVARANVAGLSDDAAVVPWKGGDVVLTTDILQEGTHFPPEMTPEEAGAFAVNVNLSDLAAMGAEAVGILVALGIPAATPVERVERFRDGAKAACESAGAEVLGGDTKEHVAFTAAVTALGRASRPLLRSGARAGDLLAVTGTLGGAAAGFEDLALGRGRARAARALRPTPRLAEGRALAEAGATACMDTSDGFAQAAADVARLSRVAAEVDPARLPLDADVRDRPGARDLALRGAGDYELVVAVPPARIDAAKDAVAGAGGRLTVVGRILAGTGLRSPDGAPIDPRGYEHFRGVARGP